MEERLFEKLEQLTTRMEEQNLRALEKVREEQKRVLDESIEKVSKNLTTRMEELDESIEKVREEQKRVIDESIEKVNKLDYSD